MTMGRYTKSLTLSDSEKIIIEASFSWVRYISMIVCFALSLLVLAMLFDIKNGNMNNPSDFFYDPDLHIKTGILFMYPFVWACIKLRNLLAQEVTLTNRRLIIKKGVSDKDTHDIPINIIQTILTKGKTLSVCSMNGSVVSIKNIKNIQQIKEKIQELLNIKENLSHTELQTQALLGITQLNFKKEKGGCAVWAFWLVLVPFMGAFFGSFFQP